MLVHHRPAEAPLPLDSGLRHLSSLPCAPGRFSQSRSRERQQPFAAQCKQVPKSPPFCTAPVWGPSNPCPHASRLRTPALRGQWNPGGGGGGCLRSYQLLVADFTSDPRPLEMGTATFTQNISSAGAAEGPGPEPAAGRFGSHRHPQKSPWRRLRGAASLCLPSGPGAPGPIRSGAKNGGVTRGTPLVRGFPPSERSRSPRSPLMGRARKVQIHGTRGPDSTSNQPAPPVLPPNPATLSQTRFRISAVSLTQPGAPAPPQAETPDGSRCPPRPHPDENPPPPRARLWPRQRGGSRAPGASVAPRGRHPPASAAALLEASGRGGPLTSRCCGLRGCAD